MRQLASLEFADGSWCLVMDLYADARWSETRWGDVRTAFAQLEQEGWVVLGEYPAVLEFPGYALARTVN